MEIYTVDAKDKKLGRLASKLAVLLMGKNLKNYKKNISSDVMVMVINASKMSLDPQKISNKRYSRFSGYPGGLKKEMAEKVIKEKGNAELIKKAVHNMLPNNKLRPGMMKKLKISE
ncbi:50S ribosomal protein L13 [Patescibacteria group bacterium]|nr:50S ribosomal protein L13 [Patescibacteria group bacterium]MBU4057574.1 50S ribosomal protein L13 [Patescibacteria group bacterium]MBU4115884.1 50S ribosomal protein L13 [Patescibacteria group bacterium]